MLRVLTGQWRLFWKSVRDHREANPMDVYFYFSSTREWLRELLLALLARRGDQLRAALLYGLAELSLHKRRPPWLEVFALGHRILRPDTRELSCEEYLWQVWEWKQRNGDHCRSS